MSKESLATLNSQTLIGYTSKRGHAWHYDETLQGDESNHYEGAIPVEDVVRRLFNWEPVCGPEETTVIIDGEPVHIVNEDRQVIIRPDTLARLGNFTTGYQPHGYKEWLLTSVATAVDADLKIGSAGLLRGGAWAFAQMDVEETMNSCGVAFRPNILATTSLDGSLSTTYKACNKIVICDNTCTAALGEGGTPSYKVKHSKYSPLKIDSMRDALGIVFTMSELFSAEIERLTSAKVDEARWNAFLDAYTAPTIKPGKVPNKRAKDASEAKRGSLLTLWNSDERVSPWKNTEWGVMAAVNTYAHHMQPTLTLDRPTRNLERMVRGEFDTLDAATMTLLATV